MSPAARTPSIFILADFNADSCAGYLREDPAQPNVEVQALGNQPVSFSFSSSNRPDAWARADAIWVWSRPEMISAVFAEHMRSKKSMAEAKAQTEAILAEVKNFAELLKKEALTGKSVMVSTWTLPVHERGLGPMIDRMNVQLHDLLSEVPGIYILDASRWMRMAGRHAYSAKSWYMGKIPFSGEVFKAAVKDVKAALRGALGMSKKILILDLDDTLWGGTVGETGWESLKIGGHDAAGEAYADFQLAVQSLKNRGVVLVIVSKNDEVPALEALKRHPAMVLRLEDFAAHKINWKSKTANIIELLAELRLGPESAVFIDNDRFERGCVREMFPEMTVPEWPDDPSLFASELLSMDCFDGAKTTREDLGRTEDYRAEAQRRQVRAAAESPESWLAEMGVSIHAERLSRVHLTRATQLLNKTNQMNLRTRRMSEEDLWAWADLPESQACVFLVKDKFADSGLTGLAGLWRIGGEVIVEDFVMSCRVMGRGVEHAMLWTLLKAAQEAGGVELSAEYIATERNRPILDFLGASGFGCKHSNRRYAWSAAVALGPAPFGLEVLDAKV